MRDLKIKNLNYNFVVLETIGDGSCLLHSIMQAFNKTYRESNKKNKKNMVYKLRNDLSKVLEQKENNKSYYENLSRGEIKTLSNFLPQLDLQNMKRHLNSHNWLDIFYVELLSNQLNLDIIIYNENKKVFYVTGDEELYHKGRNTVIINYLEGYHFETIGIKMKDIETFFTPDCDIIKEIKAKYYKNENLM